MKTNRQIVAALNCRLSQLRHIQKLVPVAGVQELIAEHEAILTWIHKGTPRRLRSPRQVPPK